MAWPHDDSMDGLVLLGVVFALGFFFLLWRYIRSTRRLALAEAQLQLVLDHVKEGVIVLNPDLAIAMMNTAGPRLVSEPGEHASYEQVQQQFDAFTVTGDVMPHDQWPSARALRGEFIKDLSITFRNKTT